jgi:hypothetical protein
MSSFQHSLSRFNAATRGFPGAGSKIRLPAGISAGAGCGVAIGYGFGAGLFVTPMVWKSLTEGIKAKLPPILDTSNSKGLPPQPLVTPGFRDAGELSASPAKVCQLEEDVAVLRRAVIRQQAALDQLQQELADVRGTISVGRPP